MKKENIKIYKSDLNWIIKNKNIDDKFNKGTLYLSKKKIINGWSNNIQK